MWAEVSVLYIYLAIIILLIAMVWFFYKNIADYKYNGLLWVHPDRGGGVLPVKQKAQGQKPFYLRWEWYHIFAKPTYTWYEDKIEKKEMRDGKVVTVAKYVIKHYNPPSLCPIQFRDDDKNLIHVDLTPNQLYDNTDWECAKRFETVKSGAMEKVKFGMGVAMVIACIVGVFLLVSELSNKAQQPAAASLPTLPACVLVIDKAVEL